MYVRNVGESGLWEMSDEKTKFSVLCSLFGWIQKSKSTTKKRSKFRKYIDTFCRHGDYFSSIRLILPSLDRERGSYGLKESVLSICLIDALGISKDSDDAVRLINWRKGGAKIGASAGNFALVATEVLQRRQGMTSGGLTIKELNDLLDRLTSCENREEKVQILSTLIMKTNAQEMKWIVMIILKDLKLGITEKSIFLEFHPDAEDLFNVTCDLRLVCETLCDRTKRSQRQDIEIGKAVRPQLAARVSDAASAWKKLHGKEVVVECKFDGDRIQIHKNGSDLHFFSRNFIDHSEYMLGMSEIISQNIVVDRCILDGEMLVWDNTLNRFAEFGSNQEIAKAAKDGLNVERQLCYVAFDILYVGDTSVIHRSLKERHVILQQIVKPLKGRLEIVIPNGRGNSKSPSTESCRSFIARSVDDVHRFFKETVENRDEGIILKDLSSKWEPGDRSGKWLKLKPDYVRSGSDIDVLIIGGYYGSGRRGGEVTQFLVGLAESVAPNEHPRMFISFCRVGSGLSDEELDSVVTKLRPYFQKYDYPKKTHPNCYQVTNHSKERPDVWVDNPKNSIILSITSDIRTTRSEAFAAPYCLRFPRIDRVRSDKLWHECLDVDSFVELVHSNNGTTKKPADHMGLHGGRQLGKPAATSKKKENPRIFTPSHFIHADISDIKSESHIFSKMLFYFVNVPSSHSLDFFHKIVVENGGTFSMNLNNLVTHCIASESRGIKYKAAKINGDIIHYSWLLDCSSQKRLVQLHPKYYMFISDASKKILHNEVDEFSDSYYGDIEIADIKQIFNDMKRTEDQQIIEHYRKKLCPNNGWACFIGCSILFYMPVVASHDPESEVLLNLSARRLKLEVCRGGGRIRDSPSDSTHFIVFPTGSDVNFEAILSSLGDSDRSLLCGGKIHVVGSQWLELCLEKNRKLEEDTYSLIPKGVERPNMGKIIPMLPHQAPCVDSDEKDASQISKRKRKRIPLIRKNDSGNHEPKFARIHKGHGKTCQNESESSMLSTSDELPKIKECTDNEEDEDADASQGDDMYGASIFRKNTDLHKEGIQNLISQHDVKYPTQYDELISEKESGSHLEKSGDMVDPLQAMLLDMIPGLGERNVDTQSVFVEKPLDLAVEPPLKPKGDLVKKKRVSYKDTIGEIFKDW